MSARPFQRRDCALRCAAWMRAVKGMPIVWNDTFGEAWSPESA